MVSPVGSNRLPLRTYINTSKHEKNTHIYYGASEHFLRKHSRQGRGCRRTGNVRCLLSFHLRFG